MNNIICLFCNQPCNSHLKNSNWIHSYKCESCMAKYYRNGDIISSFFIKINNLKICYFLTEDEYTKDPMGCEIYFGEELISDLYPLDTFLVPLKNLKNKINNIMAFI